MHDPIEDLPPLIRTQVKQLLAQVTGGSARYQARGDRSGVQGQKEISQLLQRSGVSKNDPRWQAVIEYGRSLYYGAEPCQASPKQTGKQDATPLNSAGCEEGPAYTGGSGFRAQAEAQQRRFRMEVLGCGYERYGHWLDKPAITSGRNFLHPEAHAAAERRAAKGKGVDRQRTFGNMLSSQALCFNLFGPPAATPEGRELAREILVEWIPGLARIDRIEFEYTPPFEVFRDQSGFAGVDCDLLIEFHDTDGKLGVLVLEMKYVEESFSSCGHRSVKTIHPCPDDVRIGSDFMGCAYASKNGYLYWQRTAEFHSLRLPMPNETGCPFAGPLWQLWVNHTLAYAEASRRKAYSAVFAVCAPEANETLLDHGRWMQKFRSHVSDSRTVCFIPLERLLSRLEAATASRKGWHEWSDLLRRRYLPHCPQQEPSAQPMFKHTQTKAALTPNHWQVVTWMQTPAFRQLVADHSAVCAPKATIYFRPTDQGIVRVCLHPRAPAYLGFRENHEDEGFMLRMDGPQPTREEIKTRLMNYEAWLSAVKRASKEEQGVIPWLRHALDNHLWLSDLGPGWVFLHQEWRFLDSVGGGKKADILAAHVSTGQLGIVEFKSTASALGEARRQVGEYARFWNRDACELAPFFTELMHALAAAYGNEEAVKVKIGTGPAALFLGIASPGQAVQIQRRE